MDFKEYSQMCQPVLAPPGCQNIYPPTPPPSTPACQLVKNELCGNIEQPCNSEWIEYWSILDVTPAPSGSLIIYNGSGCLMNVRGIVNGVLTNLLSVSNQGQSKAITVNGLESIEVQCVGDTVGSTCSGRFCLTIHYPVICEVE
ncbi:hypothetical protein HF072_05975 [Bacillus sp. RO3]|nr:hypothetical protein [Bacillus sp. RO3]